MSTLHAFMIKEYKDIRKIPLDQRRYTFTKEQIIDILTIAEKQHNRVHFIK
jgi:hypothetical protein